MGETNGLKAITFHRLLSQKALKPYRGSFEACVVDLAGRTGIVAVNVYDSQRKPFTINMLPDSIGEMPFAESYEHATSEQGKELIRGLIAGPFESAIRAR